MIPPPVCTISVNVSAILSGQSAVLSWSSSNATSASLSGFGNVGVNGSVQVTPNSSTTYVLTVFGPGGSANCQASIVVNTPPPQLPQCTLSANISAVLSGGSVTLTWTSSRATSASLDVAGSVPVNGSFTVNNITSSRTFTLTVFGPSGTSATCQTSVTVTPVQTPVCTITPSLSVVQSGQSVVLSWTSQNATSAFLDVAGAVGTNGSFTVNNITSTRTFTLTVTSANGTSATCQTSVTVTPPGNGCIDVIKETFDTQGNVLTPVAQFTFMLDNSQSAFNDSTGRAHFTNVTPGTHVVTEIVPQNWTQLSVTPPGGQVSVAPGPNCATVVFKNEQMIPPPPHTPECTISANITAITAGQSVVLSWTSTNATSAFLSPPGQSVPVNGSFTVNPYVSTTYTLTVTNGQGQSANCVATVNVNNIPPPPNNLYCTLTASYGSNYYGSYTYNNVQNNNSVLLTWTSSGAIYAFLDTVGQVGVNGSYTVYPQQTRVYTLTVYDAQGRTASCQAPVNFNNPPPVYIPPPIVPPPIYVPPPVYVPPTPYVQLQQIPYTGFDFGTMGDMAFWLGIVAFAFSGAYLIAYSKGGIRQIARNFARIA